jgi:hypothetical protein
MTITFENDSDVIVYALEKIISYARRTQHIFAANCVWWLASLIGLESGLINYIDTLTSREEIRLGVETSKESGKAPRQDHLPIHPDQIAQISREKSVSATPRDLTENQCLDRILDRAERTIQDSFRDRLRRQPNRVNPLPQTKTQLKKARKIKRLQEANNKQEVERNQRLQKLRATVIQNLSKE